MVAGAYAVCNTTAMQKIILASVSPWRRKILATAGIPFSVEESGYEENMKLKLTPRALAKKLALGKAQSAARMLKMLSGRTHTLLTGIAIVDSKTGRHITRAVGTRVTFRKLSAREISAYVKTGESLTVAGGYAIQSGATGFVKHIAGDYNNIVGLPLAPLIEELRHFGVE